jgi:hypothetical protein
MVPQTSKKQIFMRAIAIDPMRRLVVEVEFEAGAGDMDVAEHLDAVNAEPVFVFETGDVLLVDSAATSRAEAALVGRDDMDRAFSFDIGADRTFHGPALVVGPRSAGGWSDVSISPERLSSIAFDGPEAAFEEPGGLIN